MMPIFSSVPAFSEPPSSTSNKNFRPRADAFYACFPAFQAAMNALAAEIDAHLQAAHAAGGAACAATSTTSLTVGTGARSLVVGTGKGFLAGQYVVIWSEASQAGMLGRVTAYASGTGALTVSVQESIGAGTIAAWSVFLAPVAASQLDLSGGQFLDAPVTVGAVARQLRDACGRFHTAVQPTWELWAPRLILPSGVAFSRASSAGYVDAAGRDVLADVGEPRFSYARSTGVLRGLLVEGGATNRLLNAFSPATQALTLAAGTYTTSVVGAGSCTVSGGLGVATEGGPVTFTLAASTTLTFTVAGSLTSFQCEDGRVATSHIPTTGAAASRAADVPSVPLSLVDSTSTEGTLYVSGRTALGLPPSPYVQTIAQIDDGTVANRLSMRRAHTTGITTAVAVVGGAQIYALGLGVFADRAEFRLAYSWAAGQAAACLNGGTVATSVATGGVPGGLTDLRLGRDTGSNNNLNGEILHLAYFPRALSQSDLRNITR